MTIALTVSFNLIFIARQRLMHTKCDIVLAHPSVSPSVRQILVM